MRFRSRKLAHVALFLMLLPADLLHAAQPPVDVARPDEPSTEKAGEPPSFAVAPGNTPLGQPLGAEVEPNGTAATATPIAGSAAVVEGNVFPNGDIDFFSFSGAAGDRVYAATMTSLSSNASTDSLLDLIDTDGSTVIESDNDNGGFGGLSSSIAGATLPGAGTYYLRVRHNSATSQLRPYRLYLQVRSGAPTPETEPNDTFPGQALPAGGWVSGATSATSDLDFYSVNLNAGDTVFLSVDLDPERDTTEWNGLTGLGTFGTPPNVLVVNDAGTTGPDSEAFFLTAKSAGTYGILVGVPTGGTTFGTYHLSATVFPSANEGQNCTTYTSADPNLPLAIPTGPAIVTSTLVVPGNPRIADLDVTLNLTHNFMADLDIQLTAPAGVGNNTVGLLSDIGSTAVGVQTTMDLTLDDEAAIPSSFTIVQNLTLAPELNYRLSWFDGQPAGGTWTLTIRDDATGDGGTLTGWSVRVCEPLPPPACAPGFAPVTVLSTDFEAGAAGFTHSGAQDEWELGNPTFAPVVGCNSGVNCWKTDLDNGYNASSNQDLLSPNINLAGLSGPVVVRWAQKYQIESASFDGARIEAREVGNPANAVALFTWLGATMTDTVGNPTVTVQEAAGWGEFSARADSLAGLNTELRFHLDSDTTVQLAGLAIDDVSVTACQPAPCTLTCPADVTQANDANQCGAVVNFPAPTPSGTCGPIVCTPPAGSFFPVGTTPVNCVEEFDAPGGEPGPGACSFNVTVNDTQPPTMAPLSLQTGTQAPACSATVNYPAPVVSDNCPNPGAATCVPPSGSVFPLGNTNVACTAQDAAGNPGNANFTVTVVDDDPPTATAPDASVGTDAGVCSAVYNYTPGYADNCPGGATVCSPPSGSTFPLGANPVTCTATDGAGNQGADTGTVTVFDDEPPVLVCPADLFVGVPPGTTSWPVDYSTPTPTDNCPGVTGDCVPPSGDPFPVGTTTVVCTASDGANQTATCDFDVSLGEQSIQEIPTLSAAGLAALALLLAGFAAVALRRRRA